MRFAEYNEENGRNEFANQFEKQVSHIEALRSLLVGDGVVEDVVEDETPRTSREFGCVRNFLETPVNDKREATLRKLFAAAVVASGTAGSSVAVASIVDDVLTRQKVAYKTAVGEMDSVDAVDALIDAAAARLMAVMDRVVEKGVPMVIDKICVVITSAYPQARTVVPIIKSCERYITGAVKIAVIKGISAMQRAAKPVLRQVLAKVKSASRKVLSIINA